MFWKNPKNSQGNTTFFQQLYKLKLDVIPGVLLLISKIFRIIFFVELFWVTASLVYPSIQNMFNVSMKPCKTIDKKI